jgi:DNA-binding response OmpR family regulator
MAELILLVNDIPDHVDRYGDAFAEQGFDVRVARTGEDALRAVRDAMPACAVIDLRLPDMSGWDLCSAMKTETRRQLPIVVLTPDVSKMCALDSTKAGCNAWLAHPTVAEDLVRTVKQVLNLETAEPRNVKEALLTMTECAACGSHAVRATVRVSPVQYYCCTACGYCWRAELLQPVAP